MINLRPAEGWSLEGTDFSTAAQGCVKGVQECSRNAIFVRGEVDEAGTFDLKHPLDSHLLCQHGHRLPPLDEQFFSGICKSYKRFHCAPNTTTDILNGAMKITCGEVGFAVDARLAKFQEFEEITNEMSSDSMVSQCIL